MSRGQKLVSVPGGTSDASFGVCGKTGGRRRRCFRILFPATARSAVDAAVLASPHRLVSGRQIQQPQNVLLDRADLPAPSSEQTAGAGILFLAHAGPEVPQVLGGLELEVLPGREEVWSVGGAGPRGGVGQGRRGAVRGGA